VHNQSRQFCGSIISLAPTLPALVVKIPRVLINAAWGLGENVVQGAVDPDEYEVFKPFLSRPPLTPIIEKKLGEKARKMIYASGGDRPTRNVPTSKAERARFVLDDTDILQLARWACVIEEHYGRPMDMEWAKDGATGKLFIVQARPETVQSRREASTLRSYRIKTKGARLLSGLSIGDAVVGGRVCLIDSPKDIARFVDGAILVTVATDPDWVPIMRRAAAIVTDHGGRTSHAAIVSRELGLPAVVGTAEATHVLYDEQEITVSCAEGDEGFIYAGTADFEIRDIDFSRTPATRTKLMLNLPSDHPEFADFLIDCSIDSISVSPDSFVKVKEHIAASEQTMRDVKNTSRRVSWPFRSAKLASLGR
jgi:pyruvate, water dikinase